MKNKNVIIGASLSAALLVGVYFVIIRKNASTTNTELVSSTQSSPSTYKDGSYSASIAYQVPRDNNQLKATITLKNDVITKVAVEHTAESGESKKYTSGFSSGVSSAVVGKKLGSSSIGIIGGASLTSNAFNSVLESIISKAQN